MAVQGGHLALVDVLLMHAAPVHHDSDAALCEAVRARSSDLCRSLLNNGADANARSGTPLRAALESGLAPVVALLRAWGAT